MVLQRACNLTLPFDSSQFDFNGVAGRLVELSGSAQLTLASYLIVEAQRAGELCAWVSTTLHTAFPPDLEQNGIDLSSLYFLWIAKPRGAVRALEYLLRSGAFGLLVFDMSKHPSLPDGVSGRLMRLAKRKQCTILALSALSNRPQSTFGSLTSLRGTTTARYRSDGTVDVSLTAERDRRSAPCWRYSITCHAPVGLR